MAKRITGRNGSIGPALPRPISSAAHPHWKTATTTPNAAATDTRFMTAPTRGTSRLRKARTSRSIESPMTTETKSGNLAWMVVAKSSKVAVGPPTQSWLPVSAWYRGPTSPRTRSIRSLVAWSWGLVVGTTRSTAAVLRVVPTTSPQDQATSDLIDRVRGDVAPRYQAETGNQLWVGGPTATFDDFATTIQAKFPLFVSVVIGLSMLLLVLAFRSLLVPLVGAVMNLVSVAAAFGVVVAVFQWGWAADLIGLGKAGPIEPFLPVILFAMLFG